MKRILIVALLAATACMQKQADGTYRVTSPNPGSRDASQKPREKLEAAAKKVGQSEPMQKMKAGGREVAEGVKEGAGALLEKTGETLQKVGKDAQRSAKSDKRH